MHSKSALLWVGTQYFATYKVTLLVFKVSYNLGVDITKGLKEATLIAATIFPRVAKQGNIVLMETCASSNRCLV